MNKFNSIMLLFPIILNFLLILMMSIPSKIFNIHPILLLFILLNSTLLICLKMNFLKKSTTPYLTFLTIIGGLMIIFLYITSLANNEMFSFKLNSMKMKFLKIFPILIILTFYLIKYNQINLFFQIENLMNYKFNEPKYFSINSMFSENNNKSTIFIMIYLYYSMICIMQICLKMKLPLRQLMF